MDSKKRKTITAFGVGALLVISPIMASSATMANSIHATLPLDASEIRKQDALDIAANFESKYGSEYLSKNQGKLGNPNMEGFISVAINPQTNELTLYWAGIPPLEIARSIKSEKIISLKRGSYSLEYMRHVGLRLISDIPSITEIAGMKFELFRPRLDGSGIDVQLIKGAGVQTPPNVINLEAKLSEKYEIPIKVTFVGSEDRVNFTASRQRDASAYSGGAGFDTSGGQYCSTGFGVKKVSTNVEYLLTAYHCFMGQGTFQTAYLPGTSSKLGTWNEISAQFAKNRDSALIKPSSSNASGLVYTGSYSSSIKEPIYGTATNVVGMSACIDGANSGYRCGVIVSNTGVILNFDGVNMTVVEGSATGIPGIVHGDSGGPVLKIGYVGTTKVLYGLGTITAGGTERNCPVDTYSKTIICMNPIYWPSLSETLSSMGLVLTN